MPLIVDHKIFASSNIVRSTSLVVRIEFGHFYFSLRDGLGEFTI